MQQKITGIRPCTWVYLLLMLLTLLTWTVGVMGLNGLTVALLVLGLSLIKGHLIGDYYMGLKLVSGGWRWVIVAWLIIPGVFISVAFYISGGG